MQQEAKSIVAALPADHAELVSVLVDAFQGDPLALWLDSGPDERRLSHLTYFTRFFAELDDAAIVDMTETRDAVAVWRRVERAYKGEEAPEEIRAAELFAAVAEAAPPPPFWYLAFLGARTRGAGAGSALLRHRMGTLGGPLALWTANPRNLPFYERRGFSVVAHVRRSGVDAWWLRRAG